MMLSISAYASNANISMTKYEFLEFISDPDIKEKYSYIVDGKEVSLSAALSNELEDYSITVNVDNQTIDIKYYRDNGKDVFEVTLGLCVVVSLVLMLSMSGNKYSNNKSGK